MDKNFILLSLYEGRKINYEVFDEYFSPDNSTHTFFTYEVLDEYDFVVYNIYVNVSDNLVENVSVSKLENLNMGHGRPSYIEKSLTNKEWKYVFQVLDQCFPDCSEFEVRQLNFQKKEFHMR